MAITGLTTLWAECLSALGRGSAVGDMAVATMGGVITVEAGATVVGITDAAGTTAVRDMVTATGADLAGIGRGLATGERLLAGLLAAGSAVIAAVAFAVDPTLTVEAVGSMEGVDFMVAVEGASTVVEAGLTAAVIANQ